MEQYIVDQIKYGLKYLPVNLAKSYFIKQSNSETVRMRKDFICGVCHPKGDISKIADANIGWIRTDVPFPFNNDGSVNPSYERYKERCREFLKHGIKTMVVTPYHYDYTEYGIDVTSDEGKEQVREIARFLITDMKDVAGAFQITNEMGIPRFTIPLTMEQAAEFIGVQLEAMAPLKGDIRVGYNSAGPQADLHLMLKPYHQYCDYIGVDLYMGCFDSFPGLMYFYDAVLRYIWAYTGKPVILQEFGYISGGHPKTKAQRNDVLKSYGFKNEDEARNNMVRFVEALPDDFTKRVKSLSEGNPDRYFPLLFRSELTNHLYTELPKITKIPGYDHTPEGQAKFYDYIIPHFYKQKFMAGMIIYCYSDSDECYVCGQSDCPIETRWGLVDRDHNPKPSYYAVKKQYGMIKWLNAVAKKSK